MSNSFQDIIYQRPQLQHATYQPDFWRGAIFSQQKPNSTLHSRSCSLRRFPRSCTACMNEIKQHVFVERQAVLNLAHSCGLGIIAEEEWLEGYQLYVVEQWYIRHFRLWFHVPALIQQCYRICDRGITSNAIKVFTGDPSHRVNDRFIIKTSFTCSLIHIPSDQGLCHCDQQCRSSES